MSLRSIDLSAFKNVTEVSDGFLAHCTSLTTVDVNPLSNVLTKPGPHLMEGCDKNVDLVISEELRAQWEL